MIWGRESAYVIEWLEPRHLLSGPFAIGDHVIMRESGVNVRQTPNGILAGTQTINQLGSVTNGPSTAGGFTWYQVNWDAGVDGWSADNYIEIAPPTINNPGDVTSPGPWLSTLTPRFTWNSVSGAEGYGLYIRNWTTNTLVFNNNGGRKTGTSYDLPAGSLASGNIYRWAMTSFNGTVEGIIQSSYRYFQVDSVIPRVTAFSVTPSLQTAGSAFTISYTVTDSGGSGLNRVELWRATDNGGSPVWPNTPVQQQVVSGSSSSGSFADIPSSPGTYWYGLHAVDGAGNWNDERNSSSGGSPGVFGPIKVTVTTGPIESGEIISVSSPTFVGGQASTVTVRVHNSGEGDDMIIEYGSKPSGWTISPTYLNPFMSSGSDYNASFSVTPPPAGGGGSIIWNFLDDDILSNDLLDSWSQPVSATPAFAPAFYDARITNKVDLDGDSYVRSFDLEFDVDSNVAGSYYVKAYEYDVLLGGDLLTPISSTFSVNGSATDWRTLHINCDDNPGFDKLSHGTAEFKLELYDATTDTLKQTWYPSDPIGPDLVQNVELSSEDGRVTKLSWSNGTSANSPEIQSIKAGQAAYVRVDAPGMNGQSVDVSIWEDDGVDLGNLGDDGIGTVSVVINAQGFGTAAWTSLYDSQDADTPWSNYYLYYDVPGTLNNLYSGPDGVGDLIVTPPNRDSIAGFATRSGEAITPVTITRVDSSSQINPLLDTWIVTHGRLDHARTPEIVALADTVASQTGFQVLTLDWSAAAAGTFGIATSFGEGWIEPVGLWAASALSAAGFAGSRLNLIGHSWGSYVSDELAEAMGSVHTIVGLDPAANTVGSEYNVNDPGEINFAAHSDRSWAFHSSFDLGNEVTPTTADESFVVNIGSTPWTNHGNVRNLFSYMLSHQSGGVSRSFLISRLINGGLGPWKLNQYGYFGGSGGEYEAVIDAASDHVTPYSVTYVDRTTQQIRTVYEVDVAPNTPTNTSPADGGASQSLTPTLIASAFSDPNPGDTHASSQWLVHRSSDGALIYDSGETTTNKTSITVSPALAYNTAYTWQVRYRDSGALWSNYSTATSFTTIVDSIQPSVIGAGFERNVAPHYVWFRFSENVSASLSVDDLFLKNTTTGSFATTTPSYDSATNTARFIVTLPLDQLLTDGNYQALLLSSGVFDSSNNHLEATPPYTFSFMRGDATGDAKVDVADLGILATNWQQSPRNFGQGDFNYDGRVDVSDLGILATNWQQAVEPTTIGFASTVLNVGSLPHTATLGDVNGDGRPDIVTSLQGEGKVSVELNITPAGSAKPQFALPQTFGVGSVNTWVAIEDYNFDGKFDIACSNVASNTITVLMNNTTRGSMMVSFPTRIDLGTGVRPRAVVAVDLNQDGRPDLVTANQGSNSISVFMNNTPAGSPTASFASAQEVTVTDGPVGLAADDFNGDGRKDLAVLGEFSNDVTVLLNNTIAGHQTFSISSSGKFATGKGPRGIAIADLNGDGKLDLAVANDAQEDGVTNTISVLLNAMGTGSATPAFLVKQDFVSGTNPITIATDDMDGDGKKDLVVGNMTGGSVSVFQNVTATGSSTVMLKRTHQLLVAAGPIEVKLGDVNGDGRPDVLVANYSANKVTVLANTLLEASSPMASVAGKNAMKRVSLISIMDI